MLIILLCVPSYARPYLIRSLAWGLAYRNKCLQTLKKCYILMAKRASLNRYTKYALFLNPSTYPWPVDSISFAYRMYSSREARGRALSKNGWNARIPAPGFPVDWRPVRNRRRSAELARYSLARLFSMITLLLLAIAFSVVFSEESSAMACCSCFCSCCGAGSVGKYCYRAEWSMLLNRLIMLFTCSIKKPESNGGVNAWLSIAMVEEEDRIVDGRVVDWWAI